MDGNYFFNNIVAKKMKRNGLSELVLKTPQTIEVFGIKASLKKIELTSNNEIILHTNKGTVKDFYPNIDSNVAIYISKVCEVKNLWARLSIYDKDYKVLSDFISLVKTELNEIAEDENAFDFSLVSTKVYDFLQNLTKLANDAKEGKKN